MAKKKLNLSAKMLIGLVAGVLLGLVSQSEPMAGIVGGIMNPVGTIFLNLVKLIVVPLVFATIIVGTCGLGDVKKFGRIGGKTLAYFLASTGCASIIGLTIAKLLDVGGGFTLSTEGLEYEAPTANFIDTVVSFFPSNALASLVNAQMIPIIVCAILVGAGIIAAGNAAKPVLDLATGFSEVMYKITGGIMSLAPYGIFALMTTTVINYGTAALLPMVKLIGVIYLGFAIHVLVVYGLSVKALGHVNPITFFKRASQAMMFAFTSQTSSACLPFGMEATRKLGVPYAIRSFILPLGATINMDGTALYQSVCTVFIASIYGLELSLVQLLMVVLAAVAASIGTAGVPNGGMATFGMVLMAAGLPVEGVALVSGLIGIIGMGSTLLNITGDLTCSVVVASSEKVLDPNSEEALAEKI